MDHLVLRNQGARGRIVSTGLLTLLQFAIEVAALCWPAILLNRSPMVYPDTDPYFVTGQTIVDHVRAMFLHQESLTNSTADGAHIVRSVYYGALTYFPSLILSPWAVVLLQAAVVAVTLRLLFGARRPDGKGWRATLLIAIVAAATTASWSASTMMPDVFAGTMALSVITIVVFWRRLTPHNRLILLVVVALGILMHMSNLPLAFGVLACAALIRMRGLRLEWPRFLCLGIAMTAAICLMLAASVIGFRQWTLAPKAPPYLLARSIADGPGRLYLRKHCPQVQLAMCQYLDRLEGTSDDFLWHRKGVYSRVPSEQEASQLRAEGNGVFLQAALEHPWMQAKAYLLSAAYQIADFTLADYRIPSYPALADSKMTLYPWSPDPEFAPPDPAAWKPAASIAEYVVVVLSLAVCCVFWVRGRFDREQRDIFLLVLATILINAMVVATTEVVPRLQARVIWLLPVAAIVGAEGSWLRRLRTVQVSRGE